MSELRTVVVVSLLISLVVGLTSLMVFRIPMVYSGAITIITAVVFFFIVLWSSYLFFFR